jgi:hypothetical protein
MALLGGFAKTLRDNIGLIKSTAANRPNFLNGIELAGNVLSTTELTALDGVTAGTVTASKAVVVDSNKDASAFRNVTVTNLDAGASGTAGSVDIFPTTASKGKVAITATANTGDTTTAITVGAQAAARTYGLPDWSTSASADTECSLAGIKVVANTTNRPGALGCLLFSTGDSKLYVCTTASATAATWTVVGGQS